ncbi:hypothetical protein ACOMHN_010128 [Nucella lapillus]
MTPSSLNGDVSCDEDYVLSEDVTPQVHCQLDSGVWTTLMAASCKQSAWRNYTCCCVYHTITIVKGDSSEGAGVEYACLRPWGDKCCL